MSQYYIGNMVFGQNDLMHAPYSGMIRSGSNGNRGGWTWKHAKYKDKVIGSNGKVRYIYDDTERARAANTRSYTAPTSKQAARNQASSRMRGYGRSITNYTYYAPNASGQAAARKDRRTAAKAAGYAEQYQQEQQNDYSASHQAFGTRLQNNVNAGINTIANSPIVKQSKGFVSDILSKVRGAVGNAVGKVKDYINFATGKELADAQKRFGIEKTAEARDAYNAAKSRYENSIFGKAKALITRIMSGAKNAYGTAKNAVSGAYNTAKTAATQKANEVREAYNNYRNYHNSSRKRAHQADVARRRYEDSLRPV